MNQPLPRRIDFRRALAIVLGACASQLAACASQPAPREASYPASSAPGGAPSVAAATPATPAPQEVVVDRAPAPTATTATPPADPPPASPPPSDPLATTVERGPASPTGECTLHLNSIPASSVEIDGLILGATPRVGVVVAAGVPHRIVFRSDTAGVNTRTLSCKAGETQTVATRFGQAPAAPPRSSDPFEVF